MSERKADRPSLEAFDAYTDHNGQDLGGAPPRDIGVPSRTQADLKRDPSGQAETARIASGTPGEDATEAETPGENLRRLGDAGSSSERERVGEAIERAIAAVGSDEADDGR